MRQFNDYKTTDTIYESMTSMVFRGIRNSDKLPVVLKLLKGIHPRTRELARYRHEFELLRSLDLMPVIKVHNLEEHENTLFLALEDFNAESLKKLLVLRPFSLEELLGIFIAVAEALSLLHERHIIHQDINPSNIVYNRQTGICKLIDFGLAVRLSPTNPSHRQTNTLRGTLAYISPEQTGRMNRQVDYRSDLYSFGVTMYELLTGRLPFEKTNSVQMIHAHIAAAPPRAVEVNPDIPPVLSDIAAKLMAKTAEQRYQSAAGLLMDLRACRNMLCSGQGLESFELGRDDRIDTFYLPQKLYGRARETEAMLGAFRERVMKQGETLFMLAAGFPGTGKTSLVKELYKPITETNGYFIEGKFDQYKRTIPYFALKQALARLVDGWLTESEDRLAMIADTLKEALGQAGQVMVELAPSLELLIGPQPEAPELSGVAAQNRFNYVCRNFFRAVATAEHPLVLFIDDLQWADLASLNLLSLLLTDSRMRYLFLIGAYRDSETPPSHPLMLMLAELDKQEVGVETIKLGNLVEGDVAAFCADALRVDLGRASRLARLIHTKTLGNPFFVTQFLKALYSDELISFAVDRAEWTWRIEEIEQRDIPDDVVQLMGAKIVSLAPRTQKLLTLAACIGNSFGLDTLSVINEDSEDNTRRDLIEAVSEGLLIPSDGQSYRFSHDRIQQAAYSLMADGEQMHLRIGRLLLYNSDRDATDEEIFEIVNQLDAARRLITDQDERLELAGLNQDAGRRARNGAAYSSALKYLSVARELLPENGWNDHYELTFSINRDLAWCLFYSGETEGIEELFATLLSRAHNLDDRVQVHLIRAEYYHLVGAYAEAIEIQKEALRLLGLEIEDREVSALVGAELENVPKLLGDRTIESLADSPPMDSLRYQLIMDILMGMWTSAYLDSQIELVVWSSCKMTNISLEHGANHLTSYGFMNYAFVCDAMLEQYETGRRFGETAIKLAEKFDDILMRGKVYLLYAVFVNHWRAPLIVARDYCRKSFPILVENGDWTYAGYCAEFVISDPTICGVSCRELAEEADKYIPFLQNNAPVVLDEFFRPACLNPLLHLMGKTKDDHTLDDDNFSEEKFLADYQNNPLALSYFYTAKLRSLYWFDYWDDALAMIDKADMVAAVAVSQAKVPEILFYACLTALACFDRFNEEERARYLALVSGYQEKMNVWAENSPDNFRHKHQLVEAELARVEGRNWEALGLYEAAAVEARRSGYINNEALAYECAARFFLSLKMSRIAAYYLAEARYTYHKWGARAKVGQLGLKYAELLASTTYDADQQRDLLPSLSSSTTTQEIYGAADSLDVFAIIQASQSLAGEIDLEKLLTKMMKIVTENAGADRAVLLTLQEGAWRLKAEMRSDWDQASIPPDDLVNFQKSTRLPLSLLQFCLRKKETVVLGHAAGQGSFVKDPYFAGSGMRSALAMPLLHSGVLKAMLYLENSLVEEAFTKSRLKVLQLLSSQIVISIENAEFYRALEKLVEQRTAELVKVNEELQQANNRLERISNIDGLTGIFNRRYLDQFLEREWRRHQRMGYDFAIILGDIDHFKRFNDKYGHLEGDNCLRRVARAIQAAARRPGDLVARYGGEEFAVVLTETDADGLARVIENIRANIRELAIPHEDSPTDARITISLGGIHVVPPKEIGFHQALCAADQSLYSAKSQGRNRAVISNNLASNECS